MTKKEKKKRFTLTPQERIAFSVGEPVTSTAPPSCKHKETNDERSKIIGEFPIL